MGSACWKAGRRGKKGFRTFYGKLSSILPDFAQERDLLSKKVLISHIFLAVELHCKYQAQEERGHSQIKEK